MLGAQETVSRGFSLQNTRSFYSLTHLNNSIYIKEQNKSILGKERLELN